jgi:hypothetical protein
MKRLFIAVAAAGVVGCATLTEDAMTPVALSFSDGSNGTCNLMNKRGAWPTPMPAVVSVRKSDDALKYDCATEDGRKAFGSIASEMGGKIIASAVFLDLGITDAITDKHRKYADSFVIPMPRVTAAMENAKPAAEPVAPATEPAAPATEPAAPATEPAAPATEPVAPATEK